MSAIKGISRDVSTQLPNFRSTSTTSAHQVRIHGHRVKQVNSDTDRSREGIVMQTRTGGASARPKQQRQRREAAALYGNTRLIPSQILDPNPTDEMEGDGDGPSDKALGVASEELASGGKSLDDGEGEGVCCSKCPSCPKKIMSTSN